MNSTKSAIKSTKYVSPDGAGIAQARDEETALAEETAVVKVDFMTATDVIHQLRALPPKEVAKVRDWLIEHDEESPELLAAIDAGMRSLEEKGAHIVTRDELETKVRQWAGKLR